MFIFKYHACFTNIVSQKKNPIFLIFCGNIYVYGLYLLLWYLTQNLGKCQPYTMTHHITTYTNPLFYTTLSCVFEKQVIIFVFWKKTCSWKEKCLGRWDLAREALRLEENVLSNVFFQKRTHSHRLRRTTSQCNHDIPNYGTGLGRKLVDVSVKMPSLL